MNKQNKKTYKGRQENSDTGEKGDGKGKLGKRAQLYSDRN